MEEPTVAQIRSKQAIQSAETAYEAGLDRAIDQLCTIEQEDPEIFEFFLTEKVFDLQYGGAGRLPSFTKDNRPEGIYFIQSIQKIGQLGTYRLFTNAFATSDKIRQELVQLEIPVKENGVG